MWKTISAISAAAAIIGALGFFYGSDVKASVPAALSVKGDRADLPQSCGQHSWPYYQATCLRDDTRNAARASTIRLISTDRVPQTDPNTNPYLAPYWPGMMTELQYVNPGWKRAAK
jgi:hypothetical protein